MTLILVFEAYGQSAYSAGLQSPGTDSRGLSSTRKSSALREKEKATKNAWPGSEMDLKCLVKLQ